MILKDAFGQKEPQSEARRSIIALVRMSALLARDTHDDEGEEDKEEDANSSVYDSVERGALSDGAPSFESFHARLDRQNEHLSGEAKREFQKRWGFAPEYDALDSQSNIFGSDREVVSGISAKMWSTLCSSQNENKTRKQMLSKAIKEASQFSNEKIQKLKLASDIQVGLEIMHLFIIDLLGLVPDFILILNMLCNRH